MYKFAIITYGKVTNIIESNDYDMLELLKQHNETVVLANNQEVEIGYLWDGSRFSKDQFLADAETKSSERQMNQMQEQKMKLYNELLVKENRTTEESHELDFLKIELNL